MKPLIQQMRDKLRTLIDQLTIDVAKMFIGQTGRYLAQWNAQQPPYVTRMRINMMMHIRLFEQSVTLTHHQGYGSVVSLREGHIIRTQSFYNKLKGCVHQGTVVIYGQVLDVLLNLQINGLVEMLDDPQLVGSMGMIVSHLDVQHRVLQQMIASRDHLDAQSVQDFHDSVIEILRAIEELHHSLVS